MGRRTNSILLALVMTFALSALLPAALLAGQKEMDHEVELGKEAVAQAEKDMKLVSDAALLKRVDTIGQKVAAVAKVDKFKALYGTDELANFNYVFKIVDDKDVNAFSLPGGFIYVNKGLLDRVESDDELAGVLAHEIAHCSHHHMAALLKRQAKLQTNMMIVAAVAILAGTQSGDTNNLLLGAQLVSIAKLNTYGREAEKDADMTAIEYMTKTGYNPVGMLTFMEKLARDNTYRQDNLGIFATHPPSKDRADVITADLKRRGITINRRAVSKSLVVTIKEDLINGQKISQVYISGKPVFAPAPAGGQTSKERADEIAKRLNEALDKDPSGRDVKIIADDQSLTIKDEVIINFFPEDAKLLELSRQRLASQTQNYISRVLYDTWLKDMYW